MKMYNLYKQNSKISLQL